jgi:hypothetical protein
MTITILPSRNEYTATAGQTVFNYTFKIFASTDLNVFVTPAGQDADDTTDQTMSFSVTNIGDEDGGTMTLVTPASVGDLVTIVSDIPENRTTDYQDNGDFIPATVNDDFDRVVSLVKQLDEKTNRSLISQESQQGAKPLTLPEPDAGLFIKWNIGETGLENTGVPAVLITDTTYNVVSDMIADTTLEVGAIVRTAGYIEMGDAGSNDYQIVAAGTGTADGGSFIDLINHQAKALFSNGQVNVRQFGSAGDFLADDTAAVQAALDFVRLNDRGALHIPSGTYKITDTLDYNVSAVSSQRASRLKVTGDGVSSLLKMSGLAGGLFVYTASNSFVEGYLRMYDMSLTGDLTTGSIGIVIKGGTAFNIIENVVIEAFDFGLDFRDLDQTNFIGLIIRWCSHGGFLRGNLEVTGHNNLQFYGCTISNNSTYGLHIEEPHAVSFFGGSFQYNGTIGGPVTEYGIELKSNIVGYGNVNFEGVVFEGNGGLADIIHTADTFANTLNVKNCAFLRVDVVTVGYAINNIHTTGTSTEHRINLSGNLHKATVSYTPSAARPYLNFAVGIEKVYDDGTNYYEDLVEAPKLSGWTAQSVPWEPQLWDDSESNSEGQTYNASTEGSYFRMGNSVFITGRLRMTSLGSLTGANDATIGNLPYQPIAPGSIDIGYTFSLNLAAAGSVVGFVDAGSKKVSLWSQDTTGGGSGLSITEMSATGDIIFSGWFLTDDPV